MRIFLEVYKTGFPAHVVAVAVPYVVTWGSHRDVLIL